MMKRLTWFVGGAVAGVAGAGIAKRKVKSKAAELAPANLARGARRRVADAFSEGRRAMRAKEIELRARLDGRPATVADELADVDMLLVDGEPVEPGKVIVLRQVREQPGRRRKRA